MNPETHYAVALSYLQGVGPVRARRLLAEAGSFAACFALSAADYARLKIPPTAIEQLCSKSVLATAEREVEFVAKHQIEIIDCLSADYPRRLEDMPDAPLLLYKRGRAGLSPKRAVAIVGTRKPTPYGIAACERLVGELAQYGATVLSGLAYGVDIAAHEASLRAGVPTTAVLAHGLGEVYPSIHRATAIRMLETGALVTEYPSGLRSRKEFFPQRNRVIAGLADAVVVIESGREGGSMITAKLAGEYNRPLFALPGRNGDPMSAGPNHLIKAQQAHLLEGAHDLAYLLGWAKPSGAPQARPPEPPALFETFSPVEASVVALLQQAAELDIDSISHQASLGSGQLASTLLDLELRGVVDALPGKRYRLSR